LANVSFAGMSALWRTLAFIFGLPSTIVTFLGVDEGGNRVPHRFTAKGKAGGYQGCRNHLAGDESPWRESIDWGAISGFMGRPPLLQPHTATL